MNSTSNTRRYPEKLCCLPSGLGSISRALFVLLLALSLAACERESNNTKQSQLLEQQKTKQAAEQRKIELCRDDPGCDLKPMPAYDEKIHHINKWNGQWFLIPREYDYERGFGFYWPSKRSQALGPTQSSGDDWHIYLYPRSHNIPPEPRGYRRILLAEKEGRVLKRETLRKGLDRIIYFDLYRPGVLDTVQAIEYVATDRLDPEGQPPVLRCKMDMANPERAGGGAGFIWRDDILVEVLIRGGNVCEDWPELFDEVVRVLNLAKKV